MSFTTLVQIFMDLVLVATSAFLWVKLNRPQKDDPRMSRGLQLLQSKIAVLEDLSDQVETQVQQISALIEAKVREIQSQILSSDKQIQRIEAAMAKSLEVANIFQDRIPHQEIVERQNTLKYVKAARMAHQGVALDAIAKEVDLPVGEIALIAKINRENLQFSEEDLPEWARTAEQKANDLAPAVDQNRQELVPQALTRNSDRNDLLNSIGAKLREVLPPIQGAGTPNERPIIEMPRPKATFGSVEMAPVKANELAPKEKAQTSSGKSVDVQKVIFPRVDMTQHLS